MLNARRGPKDRSYGRGHVCVEQAERWCCGNRVVWPALFEADAGGGWFAEGSRRVEGLVGYAVLQGLCL